MKVYNAMQLKNGAKADYNKLGTLTQPIQFLPYSEKDDEWKAHCIDWIEWQGIKQIKRNSRKLIKNYKLAKGIIDKSDYIIDVENEYADLMDILTKEDESAIELKFYPIIPTIVNLLTAEFAKRNTKITFRAIDDLSYNEMLEEKRAEIENVLMIDASTKIMEKMIEQGVDPSSEDFQNAMSPENLKTLPQIQEYYDKSYRSLYEEWATHQTNVDIERFKMDELETVAFRDMLITDREFWHFKMNEDDYDIELWNPLTTFYHKSPEIRYISNASWCGKIDMLTVSDVIDKYGYLMSAEELEQLEAIYPIKSAAYPIQGMQNDGSYYDATKSHDWNTTGPSLAMRQYMSLYGDNMSNSNDVVNWLLSDSEDYVDFGSTHLLRCATIYWKSQRKVGHLFKIDETGAVTQKIIDETYVVTDKPIYDNRFSKQKTEDTLLFGEHIEWIWINDVWGGVKIGPNLPSFWGMNNTSGFAPLYLGIGTDTPDRLKYQFRGDNNIYGCKLPVEGSVFSDRNTKSIALVDTLKPFQIGFNLVNNQVADILIDELGTVIVFDQNGLPQHSMGEDWGKNNLAKAYVAMKDFQMLPLDTTLTNTESTMNFQHYQVLNMEQTNRLMSRIQLANYFKQQAYESIGITQERAGRTPLDQKTPQSATGIRASLASSYSQTEMYFVNHCDYLMPRVHQMRTDLAQFYNSTKPSLRLQYITSTADKVNFQINGTKLLGRELNVFATTKANHRAILEKMQRMATENNTLGASIYDLGRVIQSESISEVTQVLKKAEEKAMQQHNQEYQSKQEEYQARIAAELEEKERQRAFEAEQNDKDRQSEIIVAEIKAASYAGQSDINENNRNDYEDALDRIENTQQFREQMDIQREKMVNDQVISREKLNIEKQKLNSQKDIAAKQLQIAQENQTRAELIAKGKLKNKDKK